MFDISIEYAHIYTNQKIDDEHRVSVEILDAVTKNCKQKNQTYSLAVMVDDYSFPDPSFDYHEFLDWLQAQGFAADVWMRESQLISTCDEVLCLMGMPYKTPLVEYVKAKKYPCSLFIAAWYLLRLGYLSSDIYPIKYVSKEIISILPKSFKPFEDKALHIIKRTQHAKAANHISHEYFSVPGLRRR